MVLRSIAHLPGRVDTDDFQRYFLYLLEQVRAAVYDDGGGRLVVAKKC